MTALPESLFELIVRYDRTKKLVAYGDVEVGDHTHHTLQKLINVQSPSTHVFFGGNRQP